MKKFISILLAIMLLFTFTACGSSGGDSSVEKAWYFGGAGILQDDFDVEEVFVNVKDTINPAQIYDSVEFTENMLYGSYTLDDMEKDVKNVRKNIPFETVDFNNGSYEIATLPIGVHFGTDNISTSVTGYKYSEFKVITEYELAVLQFATTDDIGSIVCTYEIDGDTIIFKQIEDANESADVFEYDFTGVEFKYNFKIAGPYLTLSNGENSLKLTSYSFTENMDSDPTMHGYSLANSPLIDELDYFTSWGQDSINYAVKRDGTYYNSLAFKLADNGIITVYLEDTNDAGETVKFVEQYAYITKSSCGFMNDFSIILLDGEKQYYYTDDITDREARILEDDGISTDELSEEEIKEIAEKKSDLFDDLYNEFEAQGINVTINRSTGEIAMDASVLFGGDSAVITEDGKALLNKFVAAYTSIIYNEKYDGFISKTMVEGHTAPTANSTYETGLPLSNQRANNVKDYCLSAEVGVDTTELATTLEAVGMSNSKPIYDANGEIDYAACRRVSFRFIVNVE